MSNRVRVPPELAGGPFTRATALQHVTARQLKHPTYKALSTGVYIVAEEVTHGDRIRAARLVLPDQTVLIGRSAMWALGVEIAGSTDRVEVNVTSPAGMRRVDLLRARRGAIEPSEIVQTRWGPATSAARTAFDLARLENVLVGVPLLDILVRQTRVTRSEIEAVARAHPGTRGVRRVSPALDLIDPRAESIRESLLRVHLVLGGLPRPQSQIRVFNDVQEFVARVDLGWIRLRIAVEYDGAHHDTPAQIAQDRARINALRAAGWTVIVIDRRQLARPHEVVELVRRVVAASEAALG